MTQYLIFVDLHHIPKPVVSACGDAMCTHGPTHMLDGRVLKHSWIT